MILKLSHHHRCLHIYRQKSINFCRFIYTLKLYKFRKANVFMNLNGHDMAIDDVNLQIIDILAKDSSTPFVEIAKRVGISDATVHLRVKRLMDEGIIRRFTLSLNNDLLGYDHLAFVGINIRSGFADQVTEELSNLEEVLELHEMHNRFDLLLKIRAKDLAHMRDIVENKVRKLPHILETELMTVLKTSKEQQMVSLSKDIEKSKYYS